MYKYTKKERTVNEMTGYTIEEKIAFGLYDWTVIKTEECVIEYGCSFYEECPCCTCDETTAYKITYARPRWSKSGKRMVEETSVEWLCSAHAEQLPFCYQNNLTNVGQCVQNSSIKKDKGQRNDKDRIRKVDECK